MAPKLLVVDDNPELLSLFVQLFEEAGYEVLSAGKIKTALELARAAPPDLAVLDVLLPDGNGFQLADSLREQLPSLPLIFASGVFKGGRHAADAKQKYGAHGYFEKPFVATQLVEAVARVLPTERPKAPKRDDAFEVELDFDVDEDQPQEPMELTGFVKVQGGGNIVADLRGAPLTAGAVRRGQTAGIRKTPARGPAAAERIEGFRGRKGALKGNFPSLINAFYLSQETGELGVQRGQVKKVIYFENGTPVFALSNLISDRFGQFLVRVGKVQPAQLEDVTAVAKATRRRTGDVLVDRGVLQDTERLYYVGQQVKSIIYSIFGWEDGAYQMSFQESSHEKAIKLDVHPANLIVRGVKKLYRPERLRRLVQPEDCYLPSPQPSYPLNEVELERWEAELLPRIDGTRSVAQIVAHSRKPEDQVLGTIAALVALNILEKLED